ncbi:MAG: hypothetical protein GXY82_04560 [Methanospirillum sp.]|nr:hypothetical protein [Methanospirillum sp.]
MRPRTATSPTAITLPAETKAWAVRRGLILSATFSSYLAELMKADLDGADGPGSDEGPVQNTTQPKRKGVQRGVRRSR